MSLDAQHRWYLSKMGISAWELRQRQSVVEQIAPADEHRTELQPKHRIESNLELLNDSHANWQALEKNVNDCVACDLYQSRSQVVFGVGNKHADCMIIGEAPGAEEDRLGEPFVGPAGKLLNNMLYAIGLQREDVFITNILKCRPPNNRDPKLAEITKCEPFLQSQMDMIKPKLIVALGRIAAHNLLKTDQPLSTLRGNISYYGKNKIPVIVTYHPAYLLRSPREKRKSWQDLKLIQSLMRDSTQNLE